MLNERVKNLTTSLNKGLLSLDAEDLANASAPISQLRDAIRETIQSNLSEVAKALITKLKKDDPLTTAEIQNIEKWIIGDAEYYTQIENNFNDWVEECKRLRNMLDSYNSSDLEQDEAKLLRLGALLTDLKYTLSDVNRYVEAQHVIE